eukprot:scaffold6007_cov183-Amphora_coffeaeformis.AAC.28
MAKRQLQDEYTIKISKALRFVVLPYHCVQRRKQNSFAQFVVRLAYEKPRMMVPYNYYPR